MLGLYLRLGVFTALDCRKLIGLLKSHKGPNLDVHLSHRKAGNFKNQTRASVNT